ncbi:MAG: Hint domain-containing protein [Ilumatobacteraceae bacterium]
MGRKSSVITLFIVLVVVLAATAGYLIFVKESPRSIPAPSGEEIIRTVGEKESSFLILKINRDSVDGRWYQVYPIERPNDPGTPKTLHVGDDVGYACEGVSDKLTGIDFSEQKITFTRIVGSPPIGGCPICLAGDTLISTPSGLVPVKDLRIGMAVWTVDKFGRRVSGIVVETSKVSVPNTHQMVHLVLDDGRELFVSAGHPTIDGRNVGDLSPGDGYDRALVVSAQRVPYGEGATYDVLPSGDTGFYWANGVLLGSTLNQEPG